MSQGIFFFIINFYCSIVALQCCVSFYCTVKWISHMYTYIPSFLDFLQCIDFVLRQPCLAGCWVSASLPDRTISKDKPRNGCFFVCFLFRSRKPFSQFYPTADLLFCFMSKDSDTVSFFNQLLEKGMGPLMIGFSQ